MSDSKEDKDSDQDEEFRRYMKRRPSNLVYVSISCLIFSLCSIGNDVLEDSRRRDTMSRRLQIPLVT